MLNRCMHFRKQKKQARSNSVVAEFRRECFELHRLRVDDASRFVRPAIFDIVAALDGASGVGISQPLAA